MLFGWYFGVGLSRGGPYVEGGYSHDATGEFAAIGLAGGRPYVDAGIAVEAAGGAHGSGAYASAGTSVGVGGSDVYAETGVDVGDDCFNQECFVNIKLENQYQTKFKKIQMKHLKIGDKIQTPHGFETVYYIYKPHKKEKSHFNIYNLKIEMNAFGSGSSIGSEIKTLSLTGHHLLYVSNNKKGESLKRADMVKVNDNVILQNGEVGKIIEIEMNNNMNQDIKLLSPVTMSGTLYVEDVKVSCYANSDEYATLIHQIGSIPRFIYSNISPHWAKCLIEKLENYVNPNRIYMQHITKFIANGSVK